MPAYAEWTPPGLPFMARDVGASRKVLATAARRGRVVRLARGVYLDRRAWPDNPAEQHLLNCRAQQLRRPGLILARESAALAHGMPLLQESAAVRGAPRFTRAELHARDIDEVRSGVLAGLRLTTPQRTALDLAAAAPLPQALVVLDAVARHTLAQLWWTPELREASDTEVESARGPLRAALRRRGGGRLTSALDLVDPRRESPPESYSFGVIHESPLPDPRSQVAVATGDGVRWPDFGWERWCLAGEVDGAVKYRGERADQVRIAEKLREIALADAGWAVVRWMPTEVYRRPGMVLDRIARALRRQGWPG